MKKQNKIDLSNARIDDEYVDHHGVIFVLKYINSGDVYPYCFVLKQNKNDPNACTYSFTVEGKYIRFSNSTNEDLARKVKSAKKKCTRRIKIDLSNARTGDEYLTMSGDRLILTEPRRFDTTPTHPFIFSSLDGTYSYSYTTAGKYYGNEPSQLDLFKRVKRVKTKIEKISDTDITLPDNSIEECFDYDDATKARIKEICRHFGIVILSPRDHVMIKELAKLI